MHETKLIQSSHFVPFLTCKIGSSVQDFQHVGRISLHGVASGSGPTGVEQGTPSHRAKLISVCHGDALSHLAQSRAKMTCVHIRQSEMMSLI